MYARSWLFPTLLQPILSSWTTPLHRTIVRVSNIGPEPHHIEVIERQPISEIDKVRIEHDAGETSDKASPAVAQARGERT